MAIIPEKDARQISDHFKKNLKGPVTIDYFTQKESVLSVPANECMYCRETGELLKELAGLSPQITLQVHDLVSDAAMAKEFGFERVPAFTLSGAAKGRVRYLGIPSGYEFSALIEDMVDVASGKTDLSPKACEELRAIQKDIHIQVFSTPT